MALTASSDERAQAQVVTRILIVEDDAALARITERIIRRSSPNAVEVVVTASGEAAIAELECCSYDLVISDYNLAGDATGTDVLAAAHRERRTPFLFLSSDERIEALGVPWLTKPCAPSVLCDVVGMLLEPAKVVREMPLDGCFDVGGCL